MTNSKGASREEFHRLFEEGVERTLAKAQELVKEKLPSTFTFLLAGGPASSKFDDAHGILASLWHSGTFPRVVDLAVCGVDGDKTAIWVRPSGHPWTTDLEETWNQPSGTGPFKALGLMLPAYLWERQRPFRLSDLQRLERPYLLTF